MKKQFYIQTEKYTNKVTDIIQIPHDGYIPIELNTPLPPNILGRCYELVGGSVIYRKEWDFSEDKMKIAELEQALADLLFAIATGGM